MSALTALDEGQGWNKVLRTTIEGVKEVAGNYVVLSLKRVKSGGVKT